MDSGNISRKHHLYHNEGDKHLHHHQNDEKNIGHHHIAPQDRVDPKQLFVHEHDDHFHAHEHYHGGEENVLITTIGLVIHSLADGTALGASLYCNKLLKSYCFSKWLAEWIKCWIGFTDIFCNIPS